MDLVHHSDINKNLYILPGGTVPPNPTELLARDGLEKAVEILRKNFDYVILDTAPVGMVTDTLLIGRVADLSVYVCRADYTRKTEFTLINELAENNKLPNLCIVINGLDLKKKKYGYYYGYGKYVLDTEKMIQEMNAASKNQTQYLYLLRSWARPCS